MRMSAASLDPAHWLRLFAVSFAFLMLLIFIFLMCILPIWPDVPAFVDVPVAQWHSKDPPRESDITVSVRADGTMFVGAKRVSAGGLVQHFAAVRLERPGDPPTIRIRMDREAMYRNARSIVVAAQRAGFTHVTFSVRTE